jgi:hypothetical protein
MGIYLDVNSKGEPLSTIGKADELIKDGAVEQKSPHYVHDRSVCVVSNGPFDAAAFIFDPREFDAFLHDGSNRPKRWLECTPEQINKIDYSLIAAYRHEPVIRGRTK